MTAKAVPAEPASRREPYAKLRELARRLVQAQLLIGLLTALLAAYWGWWASLSALFGAWVIAGGSALFAWRHIGTGVAPAGVLLRRFYGAALWKWVWVLLALWFGFAVLQLAPLPLLGGLLMAQATGFWNLVRHG